MTSSTPRYSLLDFDQLRTLPEPTWLIDGLIPDGGLAVLYGPSGTFKSFLALDWLLSVASGETWNAHEISSPGLAVYVAAEGRPGLRRRVEAWWLARGRPDISQARFLPEAVNFRDRQETARLEEAIADLPSPPRLLVVDTMARCLVGGDENSSKDVGEFIDAVSALPVDTKLVVHHTGHNGGHERGSSALQGAADLRAKVERKDNLVELSCVKVKEDAEWSPVPLRLEPQTNGSCILRRVVSKEAANERESQVLGLLRDRGPLPKRAVREAIKGRHQQTDQAISALLSCGKIMWLPEGLSLCPVVADTLGHASTEAASGGVSTTGVPPLRADPQDTSCPWSQDGASESNGRVPDEDAVRLPTREERDGQLVASFVDQFDAKEVPDYRDPPCVYPSHRGTDWRLMEGGPWVCRICHEPVRSDVIWEAA